MSSSLKISIITPSYNQGCFLEQTIQSVLQQDYPNLEYIVIDGGSSDNSVEVIRKYEKHLAYWVSERDHGQSHALLKGFRVATGDILSWLNSDDTLLPGALNRIAQEFSDDPKSGCFYGRGMYVSEDGRAVAEYPAEPFNRQILAVRNFICQPAAFFKRSAYDAVGGLDASLRFALDYDLWIRMAELVQFRFTPELLATYRLHDESKTVAPAGLVENHRETLATVLRHYRWAPLNRVYGYCSASLRSLLPSVVGVTPVRILLALLCTIPKYLFLNRGVRRDDLTFLKGKNLRLIFNDWQGVPSPDSAPSLSGPAKKTEDA